jgi:UDP-N-acetylmuramoyl-L-alanyl-D-glutamate--2,6-diaminopimelate ligase
VNTPTHTTPVQSSDSSGWALSALARHLEGAELSHGDDRSLADPIVFDLSHDSRRVGPGWLFCAARGQRSDGHDFAAHALASGASALLVERFLDLPAPQLRVPSVRHALGPAAAFLHGWPSRRLDVIGVTGTNGKTTTTYLLEAALAGGGRRTGLIGTVETRVGERRERSAFTTPEAPDLQRTLADMARAGVENVAIEVSSHALDQHRVDETWFEVAVFMNLAPEHLDYHGTIEQYYASKALLLDSVRCGQALVCVDDEWGRRLASQAEVPVLSFGSSGPADITVELVKSGLDGTTVLLGGAEPDVEVSAPVIGKCNAANVAAAYLAATASGVGRSEAVHALSTAPSVPGRFELVEAGQDFLVVVDYAHTSAALRDRIETARELRAPGAAVHVVVGARGGRDREKRQDIGRAASLADEVVLTTDSPGREDPMVIIAELRLGLTQGASAGVLVEEDRRAAIGGAIARARPGDVVLVVGRGHETEYVVDDRRIELDDRQVAREALANLRPKRRA